MITDLHKWARLFAAFAIILGTGYSLISSTPDPLGSLSGVRADLIWPAIILGTVAAVLGLTAFRLQWAERRNGCVMSGHRIWTGKPKTAITRNKSWRQRIADTATAEQFYDVALVSPLTGK